MTQSGLPDVASRSYNDGAKSEVSDDGAKSGSPPDVGQSHSVTTPPIFSRTRTIAIPDKARLLAPGSYEFQAAEPFRQMKSPAKSRRPGRKFARLILRMFDPAKVNARTGTVAVAHTLERDC